MITRASNKALHVFLQPWAVRFHAFIEQYSIASTTVQSCRVQWENSIHRVLAWLMSFVSFDSLLAFNVDLIFAEASGELMAPPDGRLLDCPEDTYAQRYAQRIEATWRPTEQLSFISIRPTHTT